MGPLRSPRAAPARGEAPDPSCVCRPPSLLNKPTEFSPFQLLPLRICSRRVVGKSTQGNRDISCQGHEQEADRALDPNRVGVPLHLLTLEAEHACSTRTQGAGRPQGQCVCSLRAGGVCSTSADIQTPWGRCGNEEAERLNFWQSNI